jgi:uncharacterized protein (DUF2237 family)
MTAKDIADRYGWQLCKSQAEEAITALVAEAVAAERVKVVEEAKAVLVGHGYDKGLLYRAVEALATTQPPYPFGGKCPDWRKTECGRWMHAYDNGEFIMLDYRFKCCPFCGSPRKEQR